MTNDILRLRLKDASPAPHFAPGHYVTLELHGDTSRDYSRINAPGAKEVEFHVRRVPSGRTSGAIHDRLIAGDRVWLTGPRGTTHLRVGHTGPILAIAGGSGLAPILSILKSAVAQGMRQPIRVYIGGRDERELYGLDRLARLASQHGNMPVTPVLSIPSAPTDRRTGFLHAVVRAELQALNG